MHLALTSKGLIFEGNGRLLCVGVLQTYLGWGKKAVSGRKCLTFIINDLTLGRLASELWTYRRVLCGD